MVDKTNNDDYSKNEGHLSSKFLETLINLSPNILYIFDLNLSENIYSNDGVEKNLGYSVEEIKAMGNTIIKQLMHPDDFKVYLDKTVLRYGSLQDGEALIHQYRMKHKDGTWHYLESNEVIYTRNPDGSPAQIFGVIHDITIQKKNHDELVNAKEYIENIINTANTIVIRLDSEGNIKILNDKICRITGYAKAELEGKNWFDLLVPRDKYPEVRKEFKRLMDGGIPAEFENPILTKSGEERYITWKNSPVYEQNILVGSISFGIDITERRKAEQILKEVNSFNKNIINSAHEGIVVYGKDLRYQVWNPFMENLTGVKKSDIIGRRPEEVFPKIDELNLLEHIKSALNGENPEPLELYYNGIYLIDISAPLRNSDGEVAGVISTVQDITERKKEEQERQKSEKKYRELFNTMSQGVVYQDVSGKIISANTAAEKILGLTLDQMQGKTSMDPCWKAVREDGSDFPGELHPIPTALKTGKRVNNVIHGVFHPDKNKVVWIRVNAVPIFREGENTPYQAYAIIEDITEQRKSEENYQMLFREMLDGFALHEIICDEENNPVDYRFIDLNPAFERMTGLLKDNIVGKTVLELMPQTEKSWIERYGKVALTGQPDFFENFSKELGKYFEVTAYRPARNQFACIFSDVTQRKKTEELLKNTQKLESLGILAGGIAHDFNNLLSGIYGSLDLAISYAENQKTRKYLEKSIDTIDRAKNLTQQLLTFAKGGEPIKKIDALFPFIKETAQFALSGSNISVEFDIAKDLKYSNFDKNQIGQVIDNIIINAQQAMPMGGIICLSACNVAIEDNEHLLLKPGDYCKISIKDSGIGIPEDYLSKIFDPFFTTKTKGHGLGLATCYSIISRHGGCIDVSSEQSKGTTFDIFLPATDEVCSDESAEQDTQHQGCGTFIVLDDEEVLRNVIGDMLNILGYNVVAQTDGSSVIDYLKNVPVKEQPVAGAILDLTVPGGLGGVETIKLIREIDENLPVFVFSGYAENPVMANPEKYGFTASICKPFRINDLSELLNSYI